MESIEMKIAKIAAQNWGQKEPQNLEEAKGITWGSEISSIKGIISVLKLEPELEDQITDDVYNKSAISEDIAKKIQSGIYRDGNSSLAIIKMLSVIHDGWVKNNPNNFLRVNKDENGNDKPRNKEYQFVPLEMLSWKEAKSDLLFIKPILEAAGVKVDEKKIEQQFEVVQKEFLIKNNIYSRESLKLELSGGAKFYTALEGLETKNGGNIDQLLKKDEIVEKMAEQIEAQISLKTKEELAMDIIRSQNPVYDEVFRVTTTHNDFNWPDVDEYMSKKEMMLSRVIGKPHPSYVITGCVGRDYDHYDTKITEAGRDYGADIKLSMMTMMAQKSIGEEEKIGIIEFKEGAIYITSKELLAGGISPEKIGWEAITKERITEKKGEYKQIKQELKKMKKDNSIGQKYEVHRLEEKLNGAGESIKKAKEDYEKYIVTPKAISKAAQKHKTTQSELRGVKAFFNRIIGKDSIDKGNIEEGKE